MHDGGGKSLKLRQGKPSCKPHVSGLGTGIWALQSPTSPPPCAMPLIINGEAIDDEILESEFRQIKGHFERTLQVACCERDPEFMTTAKDNITARVLLNQEALSRFPDIADEDVTVRFDKLVEEAGGEEHFYLKIGMPFKDEQLVRQNVANGVRMDKMLAEVYLPEPEYSDADLRAHYDSHPNAFLSEEIIRASHITKGLEGATSRRDVYEQMRKLRQQLQDGYDFDKLAEEQRGNDQQQIDLGWFKRGEFMEEFETIAFSMQPGEISPVFTTQLGFHICKLIDRKPTEPLPFDDIKDAVRTRMIEEHRDTKFNAFIDQLKASATIDDSSCGEGCGGH